MLSIFVAIISIEVDAKKRIGAANASDASETIDANDACSSGGALDAIEVI